MKNILSYVGMNLQSEVCLWSLLGLLRTIFDATLFKVNANLKQVWQMNMPDELSLPIQQMLRTMISGIMLVQCFTVYVYMAAYIVLLYPVFLEERPVLVLPWLLLAAVRRLLCELTSLALGLGICVLLGASRPPCIKFVTLKIASIIPTIYMWLLVLSFYHRLRMGSAYNAFTAVLAPGDEDYGLELAIRRRRTKSLFGEEQLRRKLTSNYYEDRPLTPRAETSVHQTNTEESQDEKTSLETYIEQSRPMSAISNRISVSCEDWVGTEITVPRDADRILEQFAVMSLRICAYLKKGTGESPKISSPQSLSEENIDIENLPPNNDDTSTFGTKRDSNISYLIEYPEIFTKKSPVNLSLWSGIEKNNTLQQCNCGNSVQVKKPVKSVYPRVKCKVKFAEKRIEKHKNLPNTSATSNNT